MVTKPGRGRAVPAGALGILLAAVVVVGAGSRYATGSAVAPVVSTAVHEGRVSRPDLCLSVYLGGGAAAECGRLRLNHALPATQTMGQARVPVLTYNSQQASPYVLVPLHITLPSHGSTPTSVTATLTAGGATAQGSWSGGGWTAGATRRVTLGFVPTVGTGVHTYTAEITNWYGSTPHSTVVTGSYTVVNRSASPFGAGWWLAGLEQLDVSTMTLVDGAGGVRRYTGGGGVWTALTVDRPDTIVVQGNTYVRKLRGGGEVVFDAQGRHTITRNARGHATTFGYDGNSRLTSVTLPVKSTPAPVYTLAYPAGYLTTVTAPGARTTTISRSGATVTAIQDPGAAAVGFGTSSGRITSRTDRRGTVTSFVYAATGLLTSSQADATGMQHTTGLVAAEGRGLSTGGTVASVQVDSAFTLVDGPRTDTIDHTRYWLDPFGAPSKVRDALGSHTEIRRGGPFPALPSSIVHANLYRDSAIYNTRGNVTHLIRLNPFNRSPAQNDTTRMVYGTTGILVDYVHRVVPPARDSTVYSYHANGNLAWQQDARGSSTRTNYFYDASGLPSRVQYPHGGVDTLTMDAYGNLARTSTAMGSATVFERDAIGRDTLVTVVDSVPTTTRRTYTPRGLLHTERTSAAATSYVCPGCVGSLGMPVPADYFEVTNTYDNEGNVTTVLRTGGGTADQRTSSFSYDALGRKTQETHAGQSQSYSYDPAGNLKTWNRFAGTITMDYDAVGRMTRRVLPEVFYPTAECNQWTTRNSPCVGGIDFDSLRIQSDVQMFHYDASGRMTEAKNQYARVLRSYYPGGALRTDTIRFRSYGSPQLPGGPGGDPDPPDCQANPTLCPVDPEFAGGFMIMSGGDPYPNSEYSWAYGLTHDYDRNGRRKSLTYPNGLPAGMNHTVQYSYAYWGPLQHIDGFRGSANDRYTYAYDASGRLQSLTYPASHTEIFTYDADSRRVRRTLNSFYNDTMRYDDRGRVIQADMRATNRVSNHYYSGLGHLIAARWNATVGNGWAVDEYRFDAHGSQIWSKKRDALQEYAARTHEYDSFGHLERIEYFYGAPFYEAGTMSDRDHGFGGDLEFAAETHVAQGSGGGPNRLETSRYYYAADGKLRAVKKLNRGWTSIGPTTAEDVIQEIRYDALGRRITQHTRHLPLCDAPPCTEVLDRFIWDGDQLVYELRANPGGSAYNTQWSSGRQGGRTGYIHGPGIDAPIAVYRGDFESSGTIRIIPFTNWRGQYERGHFSGGWPECTGSNAPQCVYMDWPAPKMRMFLDGENRPRGDWVGSLLQDQRDGSGLLFRRNRYYDPNSGLFTQPDPIGLAGGLNLYGYAGGDPINFSDPFGLAPVPAICLAFPGACVAAAGAAGRAVAVAARDPRVQAAAAATTVFVAGQLGEAGAAAGQMLRKSGRTLKKEWERLTGESWPAGCVAHHTCPLGDGGADDGSNIEPMTPNDHVQHHKDRGDFRRWGRRSQQQQQQQQQDEEEQRRRGSQQ